MIGNTGFSGQAVSAFGLDIIVALQALLLGVAAVVAVRVPELIHDRTAEAVREPAGGVRILLRLPRFRNLVLVAALILGSHAMHDAFAVIRWSSAGISPTTASLLWSESVAAEVLVFFVIGPTLVTRLTPAGALAVAAVAGMLRWVVAARTTDVMVLALVQPLHGITFALLHLAFHLDVIDERDAEIAGLDVRMVRLRVESLRDVAALLQQAELRGEDGMHEVVHLVLVQ